MTTKSKLGPQGFFILLVLVALLAASCSASPPADEDALPEPAGDVATTEAPSVEPLQDEVGVAPPTTFPADWNPLGDSAAVETDPVETDPGAAETSGAESVEQPTEPSESIPETLAFSADATGGYETMLFDFRTEMGTTDGVLTMVGQGAADGDRFAMQVNFEGLAETLVEDPNYRTRGLIEDPMVFLSDGEYTFVKWKLMTYSIGIEHDWVYMPVGTEVTPLMDETLFDPSTFLDVLYGAADDVESIGTKELDGRNVTGYFGSFAVEESGIRNLVDDRSGASELEEVLTTVWISDDRLIRQIEADFRLDNLYYRTTLTFANYGEPVNIDFPALDEAVPVEELPELFGS